jgi:hypothetical protein
VSGPAGAEASALSSDNSSTIGRIAGVVRQPRATFEAVASSPRSAVLLALLFAVYFLASAALLSTDVGRLALVDQWEGTAAAFGRPVDDAGYVELQRLSERGIPYAAVTALASGPVAAVALAAVLFAWFTGFRGGKASFAQVLAVVATASVVLMLRHLVATPLNYARETMGSPTSLALFATVDPGSAVARFLGLVDLFVVWWLIMLAMGIAVLYRRRLRGVALLFIGVYVGLALLLSSAMAVLGGSGV